MREREREREREGEGEGEGEGDGKIERERSEISGVKDARSRKFAEGRHVSARTFLVLLRCSTPGSTEGAIRGL